MSTPRDRTDYPDTKRCNGCGETKPRTAFYRDSHHRDGLASRCRSCKSAQARARYAENPGPERARARRWNIENPDRVRANGARYAERHRERRIKDSVRWRRENNWNELNRDKQRKYSQRWREANPDAVREVRRRWGQANRTAVCLYAQNRRARVKGLPMVPFTAEQLAQRWAYYGGRCWICRVAADSTDHVKPVAKGGAHMLCNLRPIRRPCNSSKRDKWPFPVRGV